MNVFDEYGNYKYPSDVELAEPNTATSMPCSDVVSRQAVDELSKNLVHTTRDKADFLCNFWEGLQKLPPVNPQEPKTGHWEWQTEDIYRCSECGEDIHVKEVMNVPQYKCCPMCLAKM